MSGWDSRGSRCEAGIQGEEPAVDIWEERRSRNIPVESVDLGRDAGGLGKAAGVG